MKTEEIKKLEKEFLRIKRMGYVESTRKGYTGIGKTFEDLLGIKENSLELPDYEGIEIKTKRSYSTTYITLFNAVFDSNLGKELKRLKDKYGYPSHNCSQYKILNASVKASYSSLVANRFLFKLKLEREEEKLYLIILNKNYSLLEKRVFWHFSTLETKLKRKLEYLALIKAWPKTVKGIDYYKYYDIDFYHLKSFNHFLKLLEDGTIQVTIKIGVYTKGERKGELASHGISFQIQEIDLIKLFDKIE